MHETSGDRTIGDFGDQWTRCRSNDGYYASLEMFRDIAGPFFDELDLRGAPVADIGSGTGRIVRMLAGAGAGQIVAVEPSSAFDVLKENTRDIADRMTYVHGPGDSLPGDGSTRRSHCCGGSSAVRACHTIVMAKRGRGIGGFRTRRGSCEASFSPT